MVIKIIGINFAMMKQKAFDLIREVRTEVKIRPKINMRSR